MALVGEMYRGNSGKVTSDLFYSLHIHHRDAWVRDLDFFIRSSPSHPHACPPADHWPRPASPSPCPGSSLIGGGAVTVR